VTRRRALLFAAAAAIGVGGATALVATRGGSPPTRQPKPAASAAKPRPAKPTLASNQIRLSHAESLRLVGWAVDLRACVARRGVVLAPPVAHEKEIDLAIVRAPARSAMMRSVIACGDALGEPPRRSSLQLHDGKLILYLPRRCLLDKRVERSPPA
jgi:hypothetical protein